MICTGAGCDRKDRCGLFFMNPQPEYRKYDNLESLANHGWGSISSEGCESHWDCGPCGNYAMFEQIPDRIIFDHHKTKVIPIRHQKGVVAFACLRNGYGYQLDSPI